MPGGARCCRLDLAREVPLSSNGRSGGVTKHRGKMRGSTFYRSIALLAAGLLWCAPAGAVRYAPHTAKRPLFVPGEVLVKYRLAASPESVSRATRSVAAPESKPKPIVGPGPQRIRLAAGIDVAAALRQLRADPAVAYAEPDYYRYPMAAARNVPDDPRFGDQWGLDNPGGPGETADADMDMPEAWKIVDDASDVTVAIIDDGFKLDAPDLKAAFDPSGGVDCSGGTCKSGTTAAETDDDQFHGTLVAGVIGAAGNNDIGIAGVAWKVHLLPIKIDFTSGSLAAAIDYAVAHGANIINLSIGGPGYSQAEFDALDNARRQGVLVVTAAGNQDSNTDEAIASYPANYNLPNIIAAAASDDQDDVAYFSTWGSWTVDVAAPGQHILSTNIDDGYEFADGTSFSSPATAGVAALIAQNLKDQTGVMPDWRAIKAHLLAGAELAGDSGSGGIEGRVAAGRVNAYKALQPLSGGVIVIDNVTLDDNVALSSANDGDGAIDPGETVDFNVSVRNDWQDESDVRATLHALNSFSTAAPGEQDFGAIAEGTAAQASFPVTFGTFSGNQHLLYELDITTTAGNAYKRYFYLNAGRLDNGKPLSLEMERTNWDEFQDFHVDVPNGAKNLLIFTHTDNGVDIDLLARYAQHPRYYVTLGTDPEDTNYTFYTDDDTLVSGNEDGDESISVPEPSSGTYHVVAINFAGYKHAYDIEACYAPPGTDQVSFAGNVEVKENDGEAKLSVTRSGSAGAISVDYATAAGTAGAGVNYTTTAGTLKWADGDSTAKSITVPVIDTQAIGTGGAAFKHFDVVLGNPTGDAAIGCMGTADVALTGDPQSSGESNPLPPDNPEPPPQNPPPPPPTKHGGGGGGFGVGALLALLAVGAARSRRTRRSR